MNDATNVTQEPSLDAATVIAIARHYCHAKSKHPNFCDLLHPALMTEGERKTVVRHLLKEARAEIAEDAALQRLMWDRLLNCEVWEVHEAIERGDKAAAVEEIYDAIAVLLRVIDVLEGRQSLGAPKTAKESEAK